MSTVEKGAKCTIKKSFSIFKKGTEFTLSEDIDLDGSNINVISVEYNQSSYVVPFSLIKFDDNVETDNGDENTVGNNNSATGVATPVLKVPSEFTDTEQEVVNALINGSSVFEDVVSGDSDNQPDSDNGSDTPFVKPKSAAVVKLESIRDKLTNPVDQLNEYQFRLSDLTGGTLPKSGVDHIVTAFPDESWDAGAIEDVPAIDDAFFWDADVLEAIVLAFTLNKKILLNGLPGTGKTTAIKQFAAWVNQPYMRFNGKDGIEQSSFLGTVWASKDGMEWKDGLLPLGCKSGYLVCIDEVFKIPAGIQMALQSLYEDGGALLLDDKPGTYHEKLIIPAESFRLMLTDNVLGTGDDIDKFASTQMQDTSTLDRFTITKEVGYMSHADETHLMYTMYPEIQNMRISKVVQFSGLVRTAYSSGDLSLTMSPRGVRSTLDLMVAGLGMVDAVKLAFVNKVAEDDEISSINEMILTVF